MLDTFKNTRIKFNSGKTLSFAQFFTKTKNLRFKGKNVNN